MNWLSNIRKKVTAITKRDVPGNLWIKCRECGKMIFRKDFLANQSVCPECQFHERIGPKERFVQIFDGGQSAMVDIQPVQEDPLNFQDRKKYKNRLNEARIATGSNEAIQVATGKIGGIEAIIAVQDFAFMAGSMGLAVGQAFVTAAQIAIDKNLPFIMFTAAGGARMQEGILSLMQMPRTTVAVAQMKAAGIPYIVVLTDPTTGGVTASYAMLGDIHLAEPQALIGFAGARVIEQTIKEKLPKGFQRSEFLREHGMIDSVVHRHKLRATLARLLSMLVHSKINLERK